MLRQQIEESYDNTAEVDDEIHGIVARNWPHLVSNLPPAELGKRSLQSGDAGWK